MQAIGAAQQQGQDQSGAQPQQSDQNASMKAMVDGIKEMSQKIMAVARLAKAVHPPALAYIAKMAEIGEALQEEVQDMMTRVQNGSQQPSVSSAAPTPTEGAPAGS